MESPVPADEERRLATLRRYAILDTPPEPAYDDIAALAAAICRTPMALITFVDRDRQWFKARIGVGPAETPRSLSLCTHAMLGPDVMEVSDLRADPRFADHPSISRLGICFYAGAPLTAADGQRLGAVCVLDREPHRLDQPQRAALQALSRLVIAQLEERLGHALAAQREAELRERTAKLAELQRQKDELQAFVVHDLRSPLTALQLQAQLLLQGSPGAENDRASVEDMISQTELMVRMLNNFLDIRRSEDGRLAVDLRPIDAEALLRFICERAKPRLMARRGEIQLSIAPGLPRLLGDAEILRRVFENLLDNAFRYAPCASLKFEAAPCPEGILVRLSDDGPGIPIEHRDLVFESYFQSGPRQAGRHGHGLGLAFCRVAMGAQRGRIWIEDHPPWGTSFCVRLPAAG